MNVWGFFYNSSVCESAAGLQDLYTTEESAIRAMNTHKEYKKLDYKRTLDFYKRENMPKECQFSFDFDQAWFVRELNVKE